MSITRRVWPALVLLIAAVLIADGSVGGPGLAARVVDLLPSLALVADVLVSSGGLFCVGAVLLWGLRHLLEFTAARRVWRHVRSALDDAAETR